MCTKCCFQKNLELNPETKVHNLKLRPRKDIEPENDSMEDMKAEPGGDSNISKPGRSVSQQIVNSPKKDQKNVEENNNTNSAGRSRTNTLISSAGTGSATPDSLKTDMTLPDFANDSDSGGTDAPYDPSKEEDFDQGKDSGMSGGSQHQSSACVML